MDAGIDNATPVEADAKWCAADDYAATLHCTETLAEWTTTWTIYLDRAVHTLGVNMARNTCRAALITCCEWIERQSACLDWYEVSNLSMLAAESDANARSTTLGDMPQSTRMSLSMLCSLLTGAKSISNNVRSSGNKQGIGAYSTVAQAVINIPS